VGVVRNAVSGVGLAADTAMVTFPIDVFLPGADLTPLNSRRQEFYDGLTRWTSNTARTGSSPMLSVEASTYEEALDKANRLFITNLWGDGLPLWPATRERVDWILRGAASARDRVIGKFPPRGGVATVESCAIALAMAGGRPEYLPVLIAAVEAFLDPAARSDLLQATSGATFPVVIVSGPIAKQIRLNSGFGCLGPDPQHPAGASIGRALRQMQQNLGGALPGVGTMAVWGAMRYTNVVFAEDEEGLPRGWPSHAVERHGYAAGANSISLIFATGANNIKRRGAGKESAEEDAVQGLHRIAGFLAAPHLHYTTGYERGTPGVVLISRVVAGSLAALGWNKQKIREFLWEHSKISMELLRRAGAPGWIKISPGATARDSINLESWPITSRPENIAIVVSGGAHSSHAFWMQAYSYDVTGRVIALPEGFGDLLADADRDAAVA
jgi:hypothetical protein